MGKRSVQHLHLIKHLLVCGGLAIWGIQAGADGFVCRSSGKAEHDVSVSVYHSTGRATRLAEVMVISDPSVAYGHQTVARFTRTAGTLSNRGAIYTGVVDTNVPDTARTGENIAGTKLGSLKDVVLTVDFSYARPVAEGEELEGLLALNKKNGDVVEVAVECLRYLKED
jgi:hypothetical protein